MIADTRDQIARIPAPPVDPALDAELERLAARTSELITQRLPLLLPAVLAPALRDQQIVQALRAAVANPPPAPPAPMRWFTAKEAATALGTSPRTLEALRRNGKGPSWVPWGRRGVRYSAAALEEHMGSRPPP